MKTVTTKTIGLTIISCLVAGSLIAAEGNGKGGNGHPFPGSGELKAYRAKQEKVRKEFREECHKEIEAFRESLKEQKPSEALPAIITQRKAQYAKRKTFMSGQCAAFVAYAKEVMTKHEVPAEKQEAFVKRMEEKHAEMSAKHEEMHEKLIAALEALKGNEDLTWQQIKETISANRPGRDGREGGHGKKHGKQHGRNRNADKNTDN